MKAPPAAVALACLCLAGFPACTPKRLVDLSHQDDLRSEQMVRAKRLMDEARTLMDQGKASQAQQKYLAALEAYPLIVEAHQGLGNIYEMEGDRLSALAEYVAHTELAPKARMYMDRMMGYVMSKFARQHSENEMFAVRRRPREKKHATADLELGLRLVALSRAIDDQRAGRLQPALGRLQAVQEGLPYSGLAEYLAGWWHLRAGDKDRALQDFTRVAELNAYFVRQLLVARADKELPDLLGRLRDVLAGQHRQHPADAETTLLLAALDLRLDEPEAVVQVVREFLVWGKPCWQVLFLKAAAHQVLGQSVLRDQALADLVGLKVDLSTAFSEWEPSLFTGVLAGRAMDLALGELAERLGQPAGSYLRWRLLAEAGRSQEAGQARAAFEQQLAGQYPAGEFDGLPAEDEPEQQPTSLEEFRGAVQARIERLMPTLWRCDGPRRARRPRPSGRVVLGVELGREGGVAQVAIEENTTDDPVLAYCIVRKVLALELPKPLRPSEVFKLPVLVGPETDGLAGDGQGGGR